MLVFVFIHQFAIRPRAAKVDVVQLWQVLDSSRQMSSLVGRTEFCGNGLITNNFFTITISTRVIEVLLCVMFVMKYVGTPQTQLRL